MDIQNIKRVAIYPAIGIARIGNLPEFFLASDIPGKAPSPENGFKDDMTRLKNKFHVFVFMHWMKKILLWER